MSETLTVGRIVHWWSGAPWHAWRAAIVVAVGHARHEAALYVLPHPDPARPSHEHPGRVVWVDTREASPAPATWRWPPRYEPPATPPTPAAAPPPAVPSDRFCNGSRDDMSGCLLRVTDRQDDKHWLTCVRCGGCCSPRVTATPRGPTAPPDGAALIAAERARQVAELDYGAAHDDRHDTGLLAAVAAGLAVSHDRDTYICRMPDRGGEVEVGPDFDDWGLQERYGIDGDEPNRLRALVIAGALLAAEIDRLQRAAARANAAEVAAPARAAAPEAPHA